MIQTQRSKTAIVIFMQIAPYCFSGAMKGFSDLFEGLSFQAKAYSEITLIHPLVCCLFMACSTISTSLKVPISFTSFFNRLTLYYLIMDMMVYLGNI